jgi:uncharacterized membrane protein YcaP (DUF421 family)
VSIGPTTTKLSPWSTLGPAGRAQRLLSAQCVFFHTWADIGRVALATTIIFLLMVVLLRVVGQQALAKMSGFDMVSTVTLGSVTATVALTHGITVSEGAAVLATVLVLQETIRWLQSRYLPVHHLVREPPRVVVWDGQLLEDRLQATNVSADEIRAAVRKAGLRSLSEVQVVVLENDGEWSVVAKSDTPTDESALFGLPIPGRAPSSRSPENPRPTPAPDDRLP